MTNAPPSRPASDGFRAEDDLLTRGLAVWRSDAVRPAPDGLAARVLDAVRRGDADAVRFRRVARVYATAAAVLLAFGVGGSVLARRSHLGSGAHTGPGARAPRFDDLETSRLARELAVTLDGQRVGDR